jgi:IMP dehydrogenase
LKYRNKNTDIYLKSKQNLFEMTAKNNSKRKRKTSSSGISGKELFQRGIGITYSDFTILNTRKIEKSKTEITLETKLGKDVVLQTPLIASPMDTVTNAELCIAIALEGGIGVIHYNHKDANNVPDIEAQIREVEKVKRYENGFIEHPVTVAPYNTINEVITIGNQFKTGKSVIDTFPVTENGKSDGHLIGLLRKQDYSRALHTNLKVENRMLKLEKLIHEKVPITLEQANEILWKEHILYLPIVDSQGNLKYLVTRTDIDKNEQYPLATKDNRKRLRVLFAVDTWYDKSFERLEGCFGVGADGVVVDTSQGFSKHEEKMLKYIAKKYSDKLIIGGNISTSEAAIFLTNMGIIDAYRCGQGSGSICTTAGAIGISRSGASGVYDCAYSIRKNKNRPVTIADGGIKEVGDINKALTIGAGCVMLGKMLAGTEEAPGETRIDPVSGQMVKIYRGMGSAEANVGGIRGYSRLPQGVSGSVKYNGSIHQWVPLIRDGMISGFEAMSCKSIEELHKLFYTGKIRFEQRSIASLQESGINVKI